MLRTLCVGFVLLASTAGAVAQTRAIPVERLQKIKAATVFIKSSVGGDFAWSGSGFVVHAAKDFGLIVTNEHVVSGPQDRTANGVKPLIEVVFDSGQAGKQWSVKAEVVYTNAEDDLAVLRVKAFRPIPEPLVLSGADKLPETTGVYVCGFPFGEYLANGDKYPEVSIGTATVSSNRTNEAGEVVTVQLNGALNPGNSGGPVVTVEGKLVGVAVRAVLAAGIGFAVPPAKVRQIVDGTHVGAPVVTWLGTPPRTLRAVARSVDVSGALKSVSAVVVPSEDELQMENKSDAAREPNARTIPATLDAAANVVVAEFPIPTTSYYWLQYVWTDAAGRTFRGKPYWRPTDKPMKGRPIPRRADDPVPLPVVTGLTGANGRPLPPLSPTLAAPLPAHVDLDELNANAQEYVSDRVTVDVLTNGSRPSRGDGPLLSVAGQRVSIDHVEIVIDQPLAERLDPEEFRTRFAAARVTGRVRHRAGFFDRVLLVAEEVQLLGVDGRPVITYTIAVKDGDRVTPRTGEPEPETRLPLEPFPLGSLERQAVVHDRFKNADPTLIGQTFRYSVIVFGTYRGGYAFSGFDRPSILSASWPAKWVDTYQIFNTTPDVEAVVKQHLKKIPTKELPCTIEFQVAELRNPGSRTLRYECLVTAVEFNGTVTPGERIVLKSDPLPPDAFVPKPAAPAEKKGDASVATVAILATVGGLLLAGLAWAMLRGRSPKNVVVDKTRRRTPTTRRDDDDDDDPRPRRRRRE